MPRDDAWSRANTLRSRNTFRVFKEAQQREAVRARESRTLRRRTRDLIAAMVVIQHLPAAAIGASAPSSDSLRLPHIDEGIGHLKSSECSSLLSAALEGLEGQREGESRDSYLSRESRALDSIRMLEEALDAHRGQLRFGATEDGSSKDKRIIEDFAGWSPAEVVQADRTLGPVTAVRRARAAQELDPETGL